MSWYGGYDRYADELAERAASIGEQPDAVLDPDKPPCAKCNDTGWCCADGPDPHRCRCGASPKAEET